MERDIIKSEEKCNFKRSRVSYMRRITREFDHRRDCVIPTAAEERSFEDTLRHVVRLFPSKRDGDRDVAFGIERFHGTKFRNGLKACSKKEKRCRKKTLKEILNALQFMERKRVYDPPADDEIRYYLLIKKYIRAILNFFYSRGDLPKSEDFYRHQFDCFACSPILHNVDELAELNRYLADFSAFVAQMDITDGSAIKPLMGIPENYEVAPIIRGSKQRNTLFYWHKLNLAFFDLRTSQYACFPPSPEEEQSYLRLLDHISSPSFSARHKEGEAVNIYSKELHFLFVDRMECEIKDLERHCVRARMSILEKLSLVEPWESLVESYHNDPFDSDVDDEDEDLVELRTRLVKKCQVSREHLPDYIASVGRCTDIARSLYDLILARSIGFDHMPELFCPELLREFGWDALHALTLFKRGSFSPGNVFRERIILRNHKKTGMLAELEYGEAKMKKRKRVADEEGDNKNVKTVEGIHCVEAKMKKLKKCVAQEECEKENLNFLEGIVEDLRCIGDSDTRLDKEEGVLVFKIWRSVASYVHFFFCAMAYEQHRYIVARGGLSHVRHIGVKTRKMMRKNSTNDTELSDPIEKSYQVRNKIDSLDEEMRILLTILQAYRQDLREKLETHPDLKPNFDA